MRPGHHRPLGTTTSMRFEWNGTEPPELGDVGRQVSGEALHDEDDVRRAYLVVGVLEGRTTDRFRLVMERVAYETEPVDGRKTFVYWNLPRR